ncbi:uncharacterized protein LOC124942053 isoform X2 [Impatiens glandulifera]|uniref:uncharacterized protein LOC124942053 isoform X2 n=1 Tax=Impatiens glandulifera TaxID=253017 RepID=UPI001FB09849|nr:uncharacterized protein LOC124942053 isoform X2 [Impatiens glandulifera]
MAFTSRKHKKPISSSSSWSKFLTEPPPDFFPSKSELLRLAAVITIATTVLITCNFISNILNRQPKPFCDNIADSDTISHESCDPCPTNGECKEGKLECLNGYRRNGRICIEDGDLSQTTRKFSELLERHVCGSYAQNLCEGTGEIWFQKDELLNNLDDSIVVDSQTSTFAKQRAFETIASTFETRTSVHGTRELKCPDLLVEQYKPISCHIRNWFIEHAPILMLLATLLVGSMVLLLKVRRKYYQSTRAEQLYNQVCEILEEKAVTSRGLNGNEEPWVVASRLRDHLLLPKERKDGLLWKKVVELIQEDSRLDQYPKLVKGDSKEVWEWQVEGTLRSSGKKNKVEESKLRSSEILSTPSNQQNWRLKKPVFS